MITNQYLELQIALSDESPAGLLALNKFINLERIDGVVSSKMLRNTVKTGQMGIGIILDSVVATINAIESPILELVKCLQKYVDNYGTNITVTTKKGMVIEISHGQILRPEQLRKISKS